MYLIDLLITCLKIFKKTQENKQIHYKEEIIIHIIYIYIKKSLIYLKAKKFNLWPLKS